jgi:glycerol uptake facilitator-like aquaporin
MTQYSNDSFSALSRKLFAEGLGTCFLLATVVGSGIMADTLSGGNVAVALLSNTLATGAMLIVLISLLGPISGAHFNPLVTLIFAIRQEISLKQAGLYVFVQMFTALLGVWLAHKMFGLALFQISQTVRSGHGQWLSEAVATFGLVFVIFTGLKVKSAFVPMAVGLYIMAAYWFTASTSFANPAVTIARSFTDSFAGIRPVDVPNFILAQTLGGLLAYLLCNWFLKAENES